VSSPSPAIGTFRFDVSRLLTPIAADAPSGEWMRYDAIYDQIRLERQEDDPVLAQGVWKTTLKKADWSKLERLCLLVLETRSKDMQIAAWLLESWIHLHGFAGVREGFRALTALSETFWDDIHPQIQEGDLEYRIGPIDWLNEKIPVLLKLLPITAPQSDDVMAYCWADWESAIRPRKPEEITQTSEEGRVTQPMFQQSAMLTPTSTLKNLLYEIEAAMHAVDELETALDARCGQDPPSLRQFTTTMDPIRGLISGIINQRAPEPAAQVAQQEVPMPQEEIRTAPATETHGLFSGGPIRSRAEAYMRLEEAAEYLARTEPHSPTPYLVRRAIAWGAKRLEEILPELVRNNSDLDEIYRLLQIQKDKGR